MYTINATPYGVRVAFHGDVTADEARRWADDSRDVLASMGGRFHVFLDMRELRPTSDEAYAEIAAGQALYERSGMDRSVVVVSDTDVARRFTELAQASGDDEWERYLDATTMRDWEQRGVAWLERGVDPGRTDVSV